MYVGAKTVKTLPGFKLLITFENGEQRVFDVSPYLDHGVFRDLRDAAVFSSVRISFDSIEWANGADLCPEVLYKESLPLEGSEVHPQIGRGQDGRRDRCD